MKVITPKKLVSLYDKIKDGSLKIGMKTLQNAKSSVDSQPLELKPGIP